MYNEKIGRVHVIVKEMQQWVIFVLLFMGWLRIGTGGGRL
jgi:hypothetical protein